MRQNVHYKQTDTIFVCNCVLLCNWVGDTLKSTRKIVPEYAIGCGRTYKNSSKNARKLAILSSKNNFFFWGGGTAPCPDPSSCGEGDTPSPHLTPLGAYGARCGARLAPAALVPPPFCFQKSTGVTYFCLYWNASQSTYHVSKLSVQRNHTVL